MRHVEEPVAPFSTTELAAPFFHQVILDARNIRDSARNMVEHVHQAPYPRLLFCARGQEQTPLHAADAGGCMDGLQCQGFFDIGWT